MSTAHEHLVSEGISLLWSGICCWEIAVTYQGSLFNLESSASHTQTPVHIWHLLPLLATMDPLVSELGWSMDEEVKASLSMTSLCYVAQLARLCLQLSHCVTLTPAHVQQDLMAGWGTTPHEHKGVGQLLSELSYSTSCIMKKITNVCFFLKGHPPVNFVSIMIFNLYLFLRSNTAWAVDFLQEKILLSSIGPAEHLNINSFHNSRSCLRMQ